MMIKENPGTTILIAYLTYILGQLGFVGFNILIFRQFSLEEVGVYGLIISIVAFAGFAFDLGITQTLVRGFSQHILSLSQAVAAALVLRLPLLGLALLAFFIWLHRTPTSGMGEGPALLLAVFSQFLVSFRTIAVSWLKGHNRQNISNFLTSLHPLGYLAIAVVLICMRKFRLLSLFSGLLVVEILLTALSFLTIRKLEAAASVDKSLALTDLRAALSALWKPSLIFFLVSFWAVVQSRLDWLLLYALGSETELAYYSLANKAYEVFESGVMVLINTAFPWLCKMLTAGEKNPRITIGFKGLAFASSILAVGAALWLPDFLTIFWGNKFAKAHNLIFLLMCGAGLSTLCSLMYYLLVASHQEKYFLLTSTVSALSQITANLIFIPKYGSYGAVIGMLVLIIVSFLMLSLISMKNRLSEYLGLGKNTVLLLVLILAVSVYGEVLKASYINTALFLIIFAGVGTLTLFSKQERSMVLEDLQGALGFLRL
jgi:O-antigen/teichoic acid export membrane protein